MRVLPKASGWGLLRLAVPFVALVYVLVLLPIPDARGGPPRQPLSVADLGPDLAGFGLAVGVALIAAGLVGWLAGPRRAIGLLAVVAGAAWFGPELFGLTHADPLVRATGRLMTPLLVPVLVHLVLALLAGGRMSLWTRVALLGLYLAAFAVAAADALTYDALWDPRCWDCTWRSPLATMTGYGIPRTVQLARAGVLIAAGMLVAGALAHAALRGRLRFDARGAVMVAGLGVAVAAFTRGLMAVMLWREDPRMEAFVASWLLLGGAMLLLALAILWLAASAWRRTLLVRDIASSLEAAVRPSTVGEALRGVLDDASLRIAYRLDDDAGFVDSQGRPVVPVAEPGQTLTPVERDGRILATVLHADRVDGQALAAAFGRQTLVALDNERLRAVQLALLAELRASRARVVAVADAERRRLERDLHDGAQQGLLALLFDLRLERSTAERTGDTPRAARIEVAERLAQRSVDALRRLAHGVYPAVLGRSGLVAALRSLAEDAAVPMSIDATVPRRPREAVEAAAYAAIREALEGATERGATELSTRLAVSDGRLIVDIIDDAPSPNPGPSVGLEDRIGAAGGSATTERVAPGGTLLRVELPCA